MSPFSAMLSLSMRAPKLCRLAPISVTHGKALSACVRRDPH
jgi:hypothetical protein